MRRMMPRLHSGLGDGLVAHDWTYGYWAPNLKFTHDEMPAAGRPITWANPRLQRRPAKLPDHRKGPSRPTATRPGIEDFCRKAQMVNMEVFKAIFESLERSHVERLHGRDDLDEQPRWPSLTWNTYDYYLEPTAAYFACKKACEPVHVQWNMATGTIKVVNNTLSDLKQLCAEREFSISMARSIVGRRSDRLPGQFRAKVPRSARG